MNDPQVQVDYEPLELPEGVRHYELSGFAETWTAYDALTREDGWEERFYRGVTIWKAREVDGRRMVVYAPPNVRPEPLPIDTSDFGEPDRDEDIPF